jgi:hypothetical protein
MAHRVRLPNAHAALFAAMLLAAIMLLPLPDALKIVVLCILYIHDLRTLIYP